MKTSFDKKIILWLTAIVGLAVPTFFGIQSWVDLGYASLNEIFWKEFLMSVIFSGVITLLISSANFFVIGSACKRFRGLEASRKRIFFEITISLITANIIMVIWTWLWSLITNDSEDFPGDLFENLTIATVITIIVTISFETRYILTQWKHSIIEKEQVEKEHVRSQLESLRTQLNPHFLFNSLNALQSLIDTDKDKAKRFVQELSKVYRYVLEHKDEFVIQLKEEMNFIQSYIYLNKIRFGENLIYNSHITGEALGKFIPPLTLQLLIENAIKHNVISSEKPLHIDVLSQNGNLIVKNNLQLRSEKLLSTGIGLQNLMGRYALINNLLPQFTTSLTEYIATVPLIENDIG